MYSSYWKYRKPPEGVLESQIMLCIMPKPCIFGDQCQSAHSESELIEWRQRLLLDIDDLHRNRNENHDPTKYREEIKQKLNNSKEDEIPVLAEIIGGHTILCDENLFIMHVDRNKELSWMFTIMNSNPTVTNDKLERIYFLMDKPDFTMEYVFYNETDHEKLPANCQIWENKKTERMSDIRILIRFCAKKFGNFCQELVFDFGTYPKVVRKLGVQVASEESLNQMMKYNPEKYSSNELSWMKTYKITGFNGAEKPGIDSIEFRLPGNIESLVAFDAFKHLDINLSRLNYRTRMHTLLFIEEYQRRANIQRLAFHLDDIAVCVEPPKPKSSGNYTAHVTFEEFMLEVLTKLVGKSGKALIRINSYEKDGEMNTPPIVFEIVIQSIKDNTLTLELNKDLSSLVLNSNIPVDVDICFCLIDTFQTLHQAVENVNLDFIFPSIKPVCSLPRIKEFALNTILSKEQKQAAQIIFDDSQKIPVLLLGPFGAGKTRTIAEIVRFLISDSSQENRVLICTHSNSAADHYIENFFHPLHDSMDEADLSTLPLRINWEHRYTSTVSDKVLAYCLQDKNTGLFAKPKVEDLDRHSLIISTLVTSEVMYDLDLPQGYFTHIFIDEAAQAMEVEALVPILLASKDTKIILAGDHMQMSEPLTSTVATDLGLGKSLLERLFELYPYDSTCKLKLLENFRSYKDIVDLSSHLFYEDALVSHKIRPDDTSYPIEFYGVDGLEVLSKENPSHENIAEATEVMLRIADIKTFWEKRDVICDLSSICVVSFYPAQVKRIRKVLRKNEMNAVRVESVNNIQGLEFDTLFISTVRTYTESTFYDDVSGKDMGFFSNPKLLNTAITRARYQVLIIGDPLALCLFGECRACWKTIIRKCHENNTFVYNKKFQELMDTLSEISQPESSPAAFQRNSDTADTSTTPVTQSPTTTNLPTGPMLNEPPPPYSPVNPHLYHQQPFLYTHPSFANSPFSPIQQQQQQQQQHNFIGSHVATVLQHENQRNQFVRPRCFGMIGPREMYHLQQNQPYHFMHRPRLIHHPSMHPFPRVFWPRHHRFHAMQRMYGSDIRHFGNHTHPRWERPCGLFTRPRWEMPCELSYAGQASSTLPDTNIPNTSSLGKSRNKDDSNSTTLSSRHNRNLSRLPPAALTKSNLLGKMNFVQDYCQLLISKMSDGNSDENDSIIAKLKGAFTELNFCSETNQLIIERVESLAEETYLSAENLFKQYIKRRHHQTSDHLPSLETKKNFGKVRRNVSEMKVFVDNEVYNYDELGLYENHSELKQQLNAITYFLLLLQHEVDVCEELMRSSEDSKVLLPFKVEFLQQQLAIAEANREQIEEIINVGTASELLVNFNIGDEAVENDDALQGASSFPTAVSPMQSFDIPKAIHLGNPNSTSFDVPSEIQFGDVKSDLVSTVASSMRSNSLSFDFPTALDNAKLDDDVNYEFVSTTDVENKDPDLIEWFQGRRNDPFIQEYMTQYDRQTANRLPSPKLLENRNVENNEEDGYYDHEEKGDSSKMHFNKTVCKKSKPLFSEFSSSGMVDYSMKKPYEAYLDDQVVGTMKGLHKGTVKYFFCSELDNVHGRVMVNNSLQVHINGLKRNNRALPGDIVLVKPNRSLTSSYDVPGSVIKVLKRSFHTYSCESVSDELLRPINEHGPAILLVRGIGPKKTLEKSVVYDVKIIDWPLDMMFPLGEIIKETKM